MKNTSPWAVRALSRLLVMVMALVVGFGPVTSSYAQAVDPVARGLAAKAAKFNPTATPYADQIKGAVGRKLTIWHGALADRSRSPAVIVAIGDSITEQSRASLLANSWVSVLRDEYRRNYPVAGVVGGRGYISLYKPGAGTGAPPTDYPCKQTVGTARFDDNYGPAQRTAAPNASATYVCTLFGTSADIMWRSQAGGGVFDYSVDGGSVTQVATDDGTATDGKLTRVTLGAAGEHTLTLRWVSGVPFIDGVIEYNGDESAGIRVHNAGHSGITGALWASRNSVNRWQKAVAAFNPKLVIISLGVNDFGCVDIGSSISGGVANPQSPGQYCSTPPLLASSVNSIISQLRSAGVSASFIVHMMHTPNYASPNQVGYSWDNFVTAVQASVANDNDVAFKDNRLRMLDVANDNQGTYYPGDTVHPSDRGHGMIGESTFGFSRPQ